MRHALRRLASTPAFSLTAAITLAAARANMRDVEEVCDRVVFMHQGRALFTGTAEEILDHFKEESLESLFIRVARGGEIEAGANPEP